MEPVVAPRTFSGRYEVTHLIARGGMAQVYRALDTRLGRHVALKVLFPELSVDQTFVERFRREAQAAANLSHPNIVAVYDWGEDEGSYFIAMELITGTSLATALKTDKTLPATRAATIAAEVASALAYAHRHGVVHRDIKPGNVLLTDEGQVKVTDFGIAQAVSTEEGLTMAGSVMGTAAYFSPEQAEGAVVDGRSDLYSLGVVLFEMLAGRPPFVGDSPVAVASMHVRNPPPMLRDLSPAVPEAIERITMRALAKSPDDRYQTADEFRADLLRFTEGQPVLAAATAGLALGATGVLGAAATSTLAPRDTTIVVPAVAPPPAAPPPVAQGPGSEEVAEQPPGSKRTTWIVVGLVVALAVVALLAYKALSGPGSISTPALVNKPLSVAEDTLRSEGLAYTTRTQASTTVASGVVISTDPTAGTPVKSGATIALVVSSGPPVVVSVPNVVTLSLQNAQAALKTAHLNYAAAPDATTWNKPVLPGSVIAQSPAPGTQVSSGRVVTITLLSSTGQFALPDVTGVAQIQAAQTLGAYQLTAGSVTSACSSSVANGLVSQTSPPPQTLVSYGTTVALTVSSGACPFQVPDVVGDTVAVATSTLTTAQLQPNPITTCAQGLTPTNIVASQSPQPPSTVKPGNTVTFSVQCVVGNSSQGVVPGGGAANGVSVGESGNARAAHAAAHADSLRMRRSLP
jgi:eukaryotic-like serine/threonine-protein kinase